MKIPNFIELGEEKKTTQVLNGKDASCIIFFVHYPFLEVILLLYTFYLGFKPIIFQ